MPLWVEAGNENRCTGVLALKIALPVEREDDRLMLELVAGYVAIIVYNAVVLMAQKYRDIESAQDDARRAIREENQLHVQNLVLDNCLSTIKHETIYYPNRIKQIIDRLNTRQAGESEAVQVETIGELISYYKDIFTLLSSCARTSVGRNYFPQRCCESRRTGRLCGTVYKTCWKTYAASGRTEDGGGTCFRIGRCHSAEVYVGEFNR